MPNNHRAQLYPTQVPGVFATRKAGSLDDYHDQLLILVNTVGAKPQNKCITRLRVEKITHTVEVWKYYD